MSGHSKWATTKRAKAVVDAKRGAIFTRLANLITIAAKEKGGDPDINFSLRMAIDKAKMANMPKENIERSIKRGTGEMEGEQVVELIYEGIGPAGSQFIVKSLTDNKNRSAAEIRHIFSKHGGSFGSVMWNFEQKGVLRIKNEELRIKNDDEELELIEAGAEDIVKEEEGVTVYTKIDGLQSMKKFFDDKKIITESADIEYVAKEPLSLGALDKERIDKFVEELEGCEDVSDYYTNIA
jgi:YebC/PmpR family DNA-binding regulatory protein